MHIAQVDEGSWVAELAFHKEVSDFQRLVVRGLLDDTLDFLEVAHAGTALDVLEVDVVILSVG